MKLFRGATRRIFLQLPKGKMMHLRKSEKVSTGPVTWCGRLGGTMVSFRSAKRYDLCSVCAELSGVSRLLEEAS